MEYKNREDVPEMYKWDLKKMYLNDTLWEEDYNKIYLLLDKVVKCKDKIMESSNTLYEFYTSCDKLNRLCDKVYIYAKLLCDGDTTSNQYKKMSMKVDKMMEDVASNLSFVNAEILESNYDTVLNYIKENDKLNEMKFDLEKTFRYKDHTLKKEEEKIIANALNAFGTSYEVFYNFDNSDIDLGEIKDADGNLVQLTNSNYIKYMNSSDRNVRIRAFNNMYEYYKKFKHTLAATYNGKVKENFFYSNIKKYNSPLEQSLYSDAIIKEVYLNLINTIHDNLDPMYEYMDLRKKYLGLDELHMYDIYVDLVNTKKPMEIPFDEGKKIVFEALKPLGNQYLEDLKKAFDEHWIDIYPSIGKKSGAYSCGSYDTYPYLLLNYNDTVDSVSTMAHELGHSMHSYYSNKNQNSYNSNYPIFLAEIASTVNEVLLNNYLYKNAKTKEEKILYLSDFLDKVRTTIYRQTMFAEFEMLAHDKYQNNIPLTSLELCNTYLDLNKLYYGNNVVSDDYIKYEWSRIPHFYTSFYVYKYATGLSAALSIASDILAGNNDIRDAYLTFLASGGSNYPLEILKLVNVDMTSTKPIEKALEMFKDKLEELKSLID